MRKLSLQWRLTILTTVLITVLCGCLTFFLYKNGVYYIDTLQETVTDQGKTPEALYIEIPDNEWDNFASQFATEVYNSKSDYRNRSRNRSRHSASLPGMQHMSCGLLWH